jgi:acetyl-CoA carboxylase biotin carboxyl carrier protein
MEIADLWQLTAWLEAARITGIEISAPGQRLALTLAGNGQAADRASLGAYETAGSSPVAMAVMTVVGADAVGFFLAAHPMQPSPFVAPGRKVKTGEIVGMIKTGYVYRPIVSPHDGVVSRILAESGSLVDYGVPLVEILPAQLSS